MLKTVLFCTYARTRAPMGDLLNQNVGQELEPCSKWLVDNKLELHEGKAE